MRDPDHVDDELAVVPFYDPTNAFATAVLWPLYVGSEGSRERFDPAARRKGWATRTAYLARYGRMPPSETRDMWPDEIDDLLEAVSELVKAEMSARSPLDPGGEDGD